MKELQKEITHRHNVILFTFSEASDRTIPLRAIEIGAGFKNRSVSAEEKASANLPACRSTYLLTRLSIPTYLPACLPTCHPGYLFSCLPTCLSPAYLFSCLPNYLSPAYLFFLPTYLSPRLPNSLPACLLTHFPACLPTCHPAYLFSCLPTHF